MIISAGGNRKGFRLYFTGGKNETDKIIQRRLGIYENKARTGKYAVR